ncbi:MAG: heme NO-binding domain-containing protein [Novosphingobium sp.]
MKGIVFNLLEEAVVNQHGEDAWDNLLDAAGLDGAYTSLGSYPDADILRLVQVAAAALGCSSVDILRWFGRAAMPLLARRYGIFFEPHHSARSFVRSVNDIIHPEVRKLYAGAGCPNFVFADDPDGRLLIGYSSPRQLCHLAHGFVEGAADRFGETVELEHLACMMDGSPTCRMAVRWLS